MQTFEENIPAGGVPFPQGQSALNWFPKVKERQIEEQESEEEEKNKKAIERKAAAEESVEPKEKAGEGEEE